MKITLEIEKSDTGMWFITSPELRGFLIAEHGLHKAVDEIMITGRRLWEAMEDARKAGRQTHYGAAQQAAYAPWFGDQP